jgi:hypothetical protein
MLLRMRTHLKGLKLARMSSGTWCVIRDLGLVKGGKGMRHHEVVISFAIKTLLTPINPASAFTPKRILPHIGGWLRGKEWPAASRRRAL